jgi:protocadherin-15
MTGIEKLSNRRILDENGTIFELTNATDVWFYAIDPKTEKILERNSSEIATKILKPDAQSQINFAASAVAHATAQGIHAPVQSRQQIQKVLFLLENLCGSFWLLIFIYCLQVKAANVIDEEVFPFALIAVAVVILILGIVGIIYICVSWSKYKHFKQRMRQYAGPSNSPPRYDPVIIGNQSETQSNLKEYETQVLAMAVNVEESDDLHIDYSAKNHAFSLDNVSYITHKEGEFLFG